MITKPPDYKIENVDEMSPFLMSITSSDNHWMFISSNGALTAGREKADNHCQGSNSAQACCKVCMDHPQI